MTLESWLLYLVLVLAATATPGPAVLFIVTNSTTHGWKKAGYAALGNITGLLILGIIATTGLGTILNSSVLIFTCIKYAGAAYLFYLGCKLIFQKNAPISAIQNQLSCTEILPSKVFSQALLVAISNPKAIVFLTALFPQFVDVTKKLFPQFCILIGTLMFFSFLALMFYALLAHRMKNWLNKPGMLTSFNRTSGAVFIGFGILLASSSNK